MKNSPTKSIVITTFNRLEEFSACLEHLRRCSKLSEFNLIIVYHKEYSQSLAKINEFDHKFKYVFAVDGSGKTAIQNMNHNRIVAMRFAFEDLNSKYVVAIEDDVLLGYDALTFSDVLIKRYCKDKNFRSVNLGYRQSKDSVELNTYGIFRYGLFGQGAAISKNVWNRVNHLNLLADSDRIGFDSLVEAFWKTGFIIVPYASRYIDIGFNGTHAPKDSQDSYYSELQDSWVGIAPFLINDYKYVRAKYLWREDCVNYKKSHNLLYKLKYFKDKFTRFLSR
jgi:hypothetical protein